MSAGDEARDHGEGRGVDGVLRRPLPLAALRGDRERVIAGLDDVELARRGHRGACLREPVERTERVAGALDEEDRSGELREHLRAKRLRRAGGDERIPEADEARDRLVERQVTPDARAHRFADQHDRLARAARRSERRAVRREEGRHPVGPPRPRERVRVVESDDASERRQARGPTDHPLRRGRRARARREEEERPHGGHGRYAAARAVTST